MKNQLLLPFLLLAGCVSAQSPKAPANLPTKAGTSVPAPAKPQLKPVVVLDTLITADPNRPGYDYWVITNPSGAPKMQGYMFQGKKEGTWREYGTNNNMLSKMEEFVHGKKNGVSSTFSNSGMITLDETYRNDTLNGPRLTYSTSARLKAVENFKNGQLDGPRKSYYDDGKIQEDGFYVNGKRNGLTTWYLQGGLPSLEYTYKNGVLDGPSKSYDDKGLVKSEGNFVNDAEEGEWKEYSEGKLTKRVIYKAGTVTKEIPVKN